VGEAKDDKEKDGKDELSASKQISSDLALLYRGLPRMMRGGSSKSPNAVVPLRVRTVTDLKADGSGIFAGSVRYGDYSTWASISTFQALFMRYRVKHVTAYATRAVQNTGAGTTPGVSIMYLDTAVTSSTPTSPGGAWATTNARLYGDGSGYGFAPAKAKPILKSKIEPEQEWFDLSSEKQLGCIAVYTYGNTASVNAQTLFLDIAVEFSGLLI